MSRWVVVLSVMVMLSAPTVVYAQTGSTITGGTPTVSDCGDGPSGSGNDFVGTITTGGNYPTSCTLSFSTTLSAIPVCVVNAMNVGQNALVPVAVSSVSASAVTFTAGPAGLRNGTTIHYHCLIPG